MDHEAEIGVAPGALLTCAMTASPRGGPSSLAGSRMQPRSVSEGATGRSTGRMGMSSEGSLLARPGGLMMTMLMVTGNQGAAITGEEQVAQVLLWLNSDGALEQCVFWLLSPIADSRQHQAEFDGRRPPSPFHCHCLAIGSLLTKHILLQQPSHKQDHRASKGAESCPCSAGAALLARSQSRGSRGQFSPGEKHKRAPPERPFARSSALQRSGDRRAIDQQRTRSERGIAGSRTDVITSTRCSSHSPTAPLR